MVVLRSVFGPGHLRGRIALGIVLLRRHPEVHFAIWLPAETLNHMSWHLYGSDSIDFCCLFFG